MSCVVKLPKPPTCAEWNALPKYDCETVWDEPCGVCNLPVEVCKGSIEVIGPYHSGCFGWPMCSCLMSHRGECS
jgi:hypothetical protein